MRLLHVFLFLVVVDIGGVGKTALAIEYTSQAFEKQSYILVRWIEAQDDNIEVQFRAFAADLLLPADTEIPTLVEAVYRRLTELPCSYLIVFDDAESFEKVHLLCSSKSQNDSREHYTDQKFSY